MNLKEGKARLWKLTGIFFAGMVVFTLLSRAVYQRGVAVVTTAAPTSGAIAHNVQLTGKTVQNQELAVTTVGGLRVAGVNVNEGQQVKQGDVLFTLDMDYLEEAILRQKQDMEKQRLSVQDAWSQNSATQKQRANQQAQAEENYHSAVSQAGTAVDRAAMNLERAEQALEDFYNGVTSDGAREEELVAALEEAKNAYSRAQEELENLNREIEAAVAAAIEEAKNQAALEPPVEPPVEEDMGEDAQADAGELPAPVAEVPVALFAVVDEIAIEQEVRSQYAASLSEKQNAIAQAELAVTAAQADLDAFHQGQSNPPAYTEEELIAAVERAREAYDDAVSALENAETTYGRAIQSANLPSGSNHSPQIGQITYDQMALELKKLEALQEAQGQILAPVEGIVTRCNVQTGEKTSDTTAMLLADMSQGCKFSGLVTEEQSKYIGVGDQVTLRASSNGKRYEKLPVTTFSTTEEPGGGYRLTVQLPPNTLTLGASAELLFTRKSQAYSCCVPISALHLDERNKPYVLVAEEVETVLGTQTQARKVSVTVLDQNETLAALDGGLGTGQKIIVGSDRAVDSGSRIRVE